jgi:uncharacterized protein YcaQ
MGVTIEALRQFVVARNFPKPTTLRRALERIGFVQADPIRAPARAQDLILRLRVNNYRAGDLDRKYTSLDIEEDFFINYGYVTRALQTLMHPRAESRVPADDIGRGWPVAQRRRAKLLLEFVRDRGVVHPREVDENFSHGKVTNYWGGSSNATTHLLDAMHYRGMLRVVRREKGIRLYSAHQHSNGAQLDRVASLDALADVVIQIYAPLPAPSLSSYLRRLRYAAPQWKDSINDVIKSAKERLAAVTVDGMTWYFPKDEEPLFSAPEGDETVRLLAPFDPVVHDRSRFELLWGWVYRFEAYTPVVKRKLGYYAMPLLWRNHVIGWANLNVRAGELDAEFGYVKSKPRSGVFKRELDREMDRVHSFLL